MAKATFWDKAAAKYARDPISDPEAYAETRDRMREILQPHHTVLEIGCGTGSTALELADRSGRYLATDVSSRMIEIAKAKQGADTPAQLQFEAREAEDMPQGPFDVVIALNLLHLLETLESTLENIYEMLPSGGIFISKTSILGDGPFFLPYLIPLMRAVGKAPYVRSLKESELRDLIEQAGFVIDEELLQHGMVPRLFVTAHKL